MTRWSRSATNAWQVCMRQAFYGAVAGAYGFVKITKIHQCLKEPMSMLCFSNRVCLFAQTIQNLGKMSRCCWGFPAECPPRYWWSPWRFRTRSKNMRRALATKTQWWRRGQFLRSFLEDDHSYPLEIGTFADDLLWCSYKNGIKLVLFHSSQ